MTTSASEVESKSRENLKPSRAEKMFCICVSMVEVQGRKSVVRCRKERKWVGGFIKLLEIGEPEQSSKGDSDLVSDSLCEREKKK